MTQLKITTHAKSNDDMQPVASGFQITFENGNTISVQFGCGNYCEQRHESTGSSSDAEVAIWNKAGDWYDFGSDQVKGWCTPDEVADWIHFAKTETF